MPKYAPPLTDARLRKLKTKMTQQDVADGRVPGLAIRVSGATGRKSWVLTVKVGGRYRKTTIGTYPALGLADARDKATDLLRAVQLGEDDPLGTEGEKDHSFRAMAEEVLANPPRRKLRRSTETEWRRMLDTELLPRWGDREAGSIERREIVLVLDEIARRAPAMAANVHSFIRWLFRGALRRDFPGLEADPASLIPTPGGGGRRERYLDESEIRKLWVALENETVATRCGFRLGLLTGQRFGNVHQFRFGDIEDVRVRDFEGPVWKIPRQFFKGRREHWVPLSDEALAVVEELRTHRTDDVWAFPSREGARNPYLTRWTNGQRRLRKAIEIEDWTAHDLRRSLRVHMTQRLGIEATVADAVLGHADTSVGARHYGGSSPDVDLEAKAEALRVYGAWIKGLVGGSTE